MDLSPRRVVARLAAALIIADDRISAEERQAALAFDEIGLGDISPLIEEEIERALHQPIDIAAACAVLSGWGPHAAGVIVAALTELAASDRDLAPRELSLLRDIGGKLGLGNQDVADIINAVLRHTGALGAPSAPQPAPSAPSPPAASREPGDRTTFDLAQAYGLLGVAPGCDRAAVDAAYLDVIARYNPAKLTDLGVDFVALAVRRLAKATEAYDLIRGAARAPVRAEQEDAPSVVVPAAGPT